MADSEHTSNWEAASLSARCALVAEVAAPNFLDETYPAMKRRLVEMEHAGRVLAATVIQQTGAREWVFAALRQVIDAEWIALLSALREINLMWGSTVLDDPTASQALDAAITLELQRLGGDGVA